MAVEAPVRERPVVQALRWRAWEAAARKSGAADERTVRRWVALRHWYTTRPQAPG